MRSKRKWPRGSTATGARPGAPGRTTMMSARLRTADEGYANTTVLHRGHNGNTTVHPNIMTGHYQVAPGQHHGAQVFSF
ncbi:MAG: hypothetical protein ACK56F_32725 [bacterium]